MTNIRFKILTINGYTYFRSDTIYGSSPVNVPQGSYDGKQEALEDPKPTISITPASGKYPNPFTVTITASSINAPIVVKYTLDGTNPSANNGITYTAPFTISTNTTVKAVCIDAKSNSSSIVTADYTMGLDVPTVSFTPASKTFINGSVHQISLNVTPVEANTNIYYSLDGTIPTTASARYTTPISLTGNNETKTIKAFAVDKLNQTSPIVTGVYVFAPQPTALVVHVKVTGYAQAPYIYAWSGSPIVKHAGDWPGTKIAGTPDVNGFYTFTFPNGILASNIIFNKGSGQAQTVDILNVDKETYFVWNGNNQTNPSTTTSSYNLFQNGIVEVYPSPATNSFSVKMPANYYRENMRLRIYDLRGNEIFSQPFHQSTITIERNNIASGFYVLHITDENAKTGHSSKLILK